MEVVADPNVVEWLISKWDGTFDWDGGNLEKLKKHGATREGIEHLFTESIGNAILIGRVVGEETWQESRYLTFGTDSKMKRRAIVWTIRENKIRPISCRMMRRKERKLYEKLK